VPRSEHTEQRNGLPFTGQFSTIPNWQKLDTLNVIVSLAASRSRPHRLGYRWHTVCWMFSRDQRTTLIPDKQCMANRREHRVCGKTSPLSRPYHRVLARWPTSSCYLAACLAQAANFLYTGPDADLLKAR
jgi:hypothetical protein